MDGLISNPNPWLLAICSGVIVAIISALLLRRLGLEKRPSEERGVGETKDSSETELKRGVGLVLIVLFIIFWFVLPIVISDLWLPFLESLIETTGTQIGDVGLAQILLLVIPFLAYCALGGAIGGYIFDKFR